MQLSTIKKLSDKDIHSAERLKSNSTYQVNTISPNDPLIKYNAPKKIDYLTIDTQGSEFDILNTLNFDEYSFQVITCEHNYTSNHEKIFSC